MTFDTIIRHDAGAIIVTKQSESKSLEESEERSFYGIFRVLFRV